MLVLCDSWLYLTFHRWSLLLSSSAYFFDNFSFISRHLLDYSGVHSTANRTFWAVYSVQSVRLDMHILPAVWWCLPGDFLVHCLLVILSFVSVSCLKCGDCLIAGCRWCWPAFYIFTCLDDSSLFWHILYLL